MHEVLVSTIIYDWSFVTHVDFRIIQILIVCELTEICINNPEK